MARLTKSKALETAIVLFAKEGYNGVSIRQLTKSIGVNEASLYNHFEGKFDLLNQIFLEFENILYQCFPQSSISINDIDCKSFSLSDFLICGTKKFIQSIDRNLLYIWRILIALQYTNQEASVKIKELILDKPYLYLKNTFDYLQSVGLISSKVKSEHIARLICSILFEFSFRLNLELAWDEKKDSTLKDLDNQLKIICMMIDSLRLNS